MVCQNCYTQGNRGGAYCSGCGTAFAASAYAGRPRLMRPRHGRVFAGVCAAFAEQYGWDPILVRLALVALVLFGCGSGVLLYVVAWMVIPNAPQLWMPPAPPSAPTETQAAA